ncbi:MAG: hypothetical protein EON60_08950 [Alphaproteobacteria bacterium]|nr:MAG: hypothetical protein EON60_08950 [Alphaproteobacteria bacterium]
MNDPLYRNPEEALQTIAGHITTCRNTLQANMDDLLEGAHEIWQDPEVAVEDLLHHVAQRDLLAVLKLVAHQPERFGPLVAKRTGWFKTSTDAARHAARLPFLTVAEAALNEVESIHDTLVMHNTSFGKRTYGDHGTGGYLPVQNYHMAMLGKVPGMPPRATELLHKISSDDTL